MNFGLLSGDLQEIIAVLKLFPEIEEAKIFGSRAKGTERSGSDIDIALIGKGVDFHIVAKVHALLEEQSKTPYLFDVVDFTHLDHENLRDHIERVGVTIYQNSTTS